MRRFEQIPFAFASAVARVAPAGALPPALADDERMRRLLERQLARHLGPGASLRVTVTDNRHTMISVRRKSSDYEVRVHRMFLDAGDETIAALGRYVRVNDRAASRLLGRFIDAHQAAIREPRRARPPLVLEAQGEVHDLQEIFSSLNRRYFGGAIEAGITWGQRPPASGRKRRSIKMGSYSVEDRLIRIHPSLDRTFVPRAFVEWIVYHEMLHQKHGVPIIGGRRQFHSAAFQRDERAFEHYELARRWEREHLSNLLLY